jgi:hypothetical protein
VDQSPQRVHQGRRGKAGTGGSHSCFSFSPLQAMGIKTALPAAELGLYSLVLSGALAYAGRGLLEASQGNGGKRGVWDRSLESLRVLTNRPESWRLQTLRIL